jgi:hypothetical protein
MGGGGKGGDVQVPPNPYEGTQARIAEELWKMTGPVRGYQLDDFARFFSPGAKYDPSELPGFSPIYSSARTGLEDQYKQARESLLGNVPRGGAQIEALTQLEAGRAGDVGSLPSLISKDIISDLYNKAYGVAWNSPQVSLGGLGGAASTYTSRSNAAVAAQLQERQMGNQMWSGLGQAAGMLGKAAILKSDRRTKDNIKDLKGSGLQAILAMNPISFDYKPEHGEPGQIGFVADDLEMIHPSMVVRDDEGMRYINAFAVITLLVKAIQEQQKVIEGLVS